MIQPVAVEVISAAALDPEKVKEQQLVSPLDLDLAVPVLQMVVGKIPGREIGSEMRYDVDAAKHFRQPVEIALVGEAVALDAVIAPFDAALAPPAQGRIPSSRLRTLTQPTL